MLYYIFNFLAQTVCQVYFTVTIDGRVVHSNENTNPKTFTNITVLAGDKKPAADASYRNLLWENFPVDHSFDIGTKVQNNKENKEIGTIDSWGPFFRVSFDLIIHSHDDQPEWWSGILSFLGNGGTSECYEIGDCIPAVLLTRAGDLEFYSTVDDYPSDYFDFQIEINHWYSIVIEQKSDNRKVMKL